jgi:hypothetical protein
VNSNLTRYYFDTEPAADFGALCERMDGQPLQSPYRSTVPLLSLVEHSQSDWRLLLSCFGAPPDSRIYFEYCVPSPKVNGNPSQTDALIMSDSTVWAIEAKWTEPRYETVAGRIARAEADGTDAAPTVEDWLRYLQPYASCALHVDDFADAIYQMVHRAASACAVATAKRLQPEFVYLHFHPSSLRSTASIDQYVSDLRHLRSLLGPGSGRVMRAVEMPLAPTAAFHGIQSLNKRLPETADKVAAALRYGPLFDFQPPELIEIL